MFLSRLSLHEGSHEHADFWRYAGDEHRFHREVWKMFSDRHDRKRDFLYRVERHNHGPRLWTLASRPPNPEGHLWKVETRSVEPKLEKGDRLDFDLRVNPVVTRDGKRHDVVMDLKATSKWQTETSSERPSESELVQTALALWTNRRQERLGIRFAHFRAEAHTTRRFPSPKQPSGRKIHISTCDLSGTLVVDEPARFLEAWQAGIGPAKGFGCGLMLIRRSRG